MRLGVAGAVVDGTLVAGDVSIEDGVVAGVGHPGGGSGIAVPGLVDLQVNGYAGVDLLDADVDGAIAVRRALALTGVTAFQPTLISSPGPVVERALRTIDLAAEAEGLGARIVGTHLEGPFLAPERAGTHPIEHLRRPDLGELRALLDAGSVTTMTIAPELPRATELVEELARRGILVSLGHSDATAEVAADAFGRGAATVTHLFNAMRPFAPRDPGLAGAALASDGVVVQLIADGVHLAGETVALAWKAAGGRVALVSDAIAAAGMGDGDWRLGSVEVAVRDGVARRHDGTLAGSVAPLIRGVRTLVGLGVPLPAAIDAASRVPADLIGRGELGRIALGGRADIVVLGDRLDIQLVLLGGLEVAAPGEAVA
jgi:N-acetylglucosamine-6-phosphate deacetylase